MYVYVEADGVRVESVCRNSNVSGTVMYVCICVYNIVYVHAVSVVIPLSHVLGYARTRFSEE